MRSFLPAILFCALLAPAPAEAGEHSLGLGVHYWKTVDAIADDGGFSDIEDDGNAFVASYRYKPGGLLFFQIDLDYYQNGYGGLTTGTAYAPMVFLGVGRSWYVAAGIGIIHTDDYLHIGGDDFTSDPYYLGRIGWNLDLLPGFGIDLNASYAIDAWNEVDQLRSDATTLGAVVRFTF